jgi:hypothetical protein
MRLFVDRLALNPHSVLGASARFTDRRSGLDQWGKDGISDAGATPQNLKGLIASNWPDILRIAATIAQRQKEGLPVPPDQLAHTSALGWAHILLTGEHKWPKER